MLAAVQAEWGLSYQAAGSINAASQAGTALSLVVLSSLADYWGPRAVFLTSSVVAAAVALLLPVLAQGHVSALLLFFVMAVAVAGSYTPGVMLIAARFEPARRGGAVGWFLASSSVGYVLALAMGGWVVAYVGWRAALWTLALGPLVCLALSAVLFGRRLPVPPPALPSPRFSLDTGLGGNRAGQFMVAGYVFHSWELLGMWAWTPRSWRRCSLPTARRRSGRRGWGRALRDVSRHGHRRGQRGRAAVRPLGSHRGDREHDGGEHGLLVHLRMDAAGAAPARRRGGLRVRFAALGDSPVYSTGLTETVPPRGWARRWPSARCSASARARSRRGCSG